MVLAKMKAQAEKDQKGGNKPEDKLKKALGGVGFKQTTTDMLRRHGISTVKDLKLLDDITMDQVRWVPNVPFPPPLPCRPCLPAYLPTCLSAYRSLTLPGPYLVPTWSLPGPYLVDHGRSYPSRDAAQDDRLEGARGDGHRNQILRIPGTAWLGFGYGDPLC